jgi:hypothetical protein
MKEWFGVVPSDAGIPELLEFLGGPLEAGQNQPSLWLHWTQNVIVPLQLIIRQPGKDRLFKTIQDRRLAR